MKCMRMRGGIVMVIIIIRKAGYEERFSLGDHEYS